MLRVLQIGYGYWGANVARNVLASSEFDLIAVCENNDERLQRAIDVLPKNVKKISSVEDIFQTKEIDAVIIATQTENSFAIAMTAMNAGKHIFIEKPIATTVQRAEELKLKATEKKLILHCDHIMIYNPVIRYIKQMIDTGELGELLYYDVSRLNLGPIKKDINAMLDLAVHDLAVLDFFTDGATPIKLTAFGEKHYGCLQETLTYLTLKYDNFIAHIKSSLVSPLKERRLMLAGSKKMLIFDDMKSEKLTIYDCGINIKQGKEYGEYEFLTRTGDIYIPYIPFEDSLKNSLEHFAKCVAKNKPSLSGPNQALRVMKILDEALIALKTIEPLKISHYRGEENGRNGVIQHI
ncbi:MAG: Gfo/Idh/MocA family oxidoreductase [Deltaproteobacteria bacterium]|jgi:predicted dehydrogenase|nr:Gfo/Idh/MocA family oxidoreductase [Deltaproteobacteria bacterium]